MLHLRHALARLAIALVVVACGGGTTATTDAPESPAPGTLRILTPATGAVVETATITFAGIAPAGARVVHDIALAPDVEVLATDGTWTLDVELDEGINDVRIRLGDDLDSEITVRVTYRPTTAAAPTEAPAATPEPTAEPTPEPTPDPTPAPTPKPTKVEYKKLPDRSWAKLVKAPDDYIGRTYQVWACVTQFDAATGPDTFRGEASNKKREYWFLDGENALFTGDVRQLNDIVQDDVVVMNVSSLGSFTYDTQIGGETTVPWFSVAKITRKGSCD
jgi:hypothetical protein